MDKYAQLKRFHHDHSLQLYMYTFMYVDTDTISVDKKFPYIKTFVLN